MSRRVSLQMSERLVIPTTYNDLTLLPDDTHLPLRPVLPHWPSARLPFESEVVVFFEQLEQIGYQIEAWTKAPYLCEGDLRQSFYWLIDVVVVVSKRPHHHHH
jgi:DREV methyltransferase